VSLKKYQVRTVYNGCRVSSPGVKGSGRGVSHPALFTAEVKERVELCLYSPSGPLWQAIGEHYVLTLYVQVK
jgi:hypothetical protein